MKDMNTVDWIAFVLVIIGAVNWGLVGIANLIGSASNWDLVALVLGGVPYLDGIVYLLVGLSGLWMLYSAFK